MNKIAIVGGGIIGIACAKALRAEGASVTVFDPDPGAGASNGNSRIFRQSHSDLRMTKLSKKNAELWKGWEEEAGTKLIRRCGLLYSGPGARERYEDLQAEGIHSLWNEAGKVLSDRPSLWEDGAGSIDCQKALNFLQRGIEIKKEKVLQVEGGIIRTTSQKYSFDKTIVAAGEGLPKLLPEWAQSICWETHPHMRIDFQKKTDLFPAWIEPETYGLPGLCVYSIGSKATDLLSSYRTICKLARGLKKHLSSQPLAYTICNSVQINGSDDAWAVLQGDTIAFAGGNSYKWAPLHGRELAHLALGREINPLWAEASASPLALAK